MNNALSAFSISLLAGFTLFSTSSMAAQFPLRADDLNLNHRYSTTTHGGGYLQGEAKDIVARRRTANGTWSALVSDGADATVNANHLIYNKPIRAMISGTVVGCWRNAPDNAKAGTKDADVVNGYIGVAGNHVWILGDDGTYALHAHAIPGTVPASICPHNATKFKNPSSTGWIAPEAAVTNGVRVNAGQIIGYVGNSGNSTGPHLHVHMAKDSVAKKMQFDRGMTTPNPNNNAPVNGPWTLLKGAALPDGPILVWAPHSTAYWTVNNIQDENMQSWFNHMADSGEMAENMSCTNNGQIYNTDWVPATGPWYANFGMSVADFESKKLLYASQGFYLYKWWYCGDVRSAIWRK
ncbi:M23 family metallopeptidase [Massilia sp. W12]|uniref:M23 family metallopeptidase n=1 Tax=Massilia sp. W12 TaxID=3126507 RepID=UPI0030D490F6